MFCIKPRHAVALGLMGWYLMTPPVVTPSCDTLIGGRLGTDRFEGPDMFLIGLLLLIATLALWVYGDVNAYRSAEKSNVRQLATAHPFL